MKTVLVLSILALSMVNACHDDTTSDTNNTTNNASTDNNTAPNREPTWIMKIDGQPEISGTTTSLIRFSEKKVTVQFVGAGGNGQITIEEIATGGLGTYSETVSTQLSGFEAAPNCGWLSGGTNPPMEVVITQNDELTFHATVTITEMTCSPLTGGGELPNISGTLEITKG